MIRPTRLAPSPSATISIASWRSEEHTSELQSRRDLVCRLLLEKKKTTRKTRRHKISSTKTLCSEGTEVLPTTTARSRSTLLPTSRLADYLHRSVIYLVVCICLI